MDLDDKVNRVSQRWTRMCLRLFARARWHVQGLLLWLLQRPSLRYVPLPYPSTTTVDQWKEQCWEMVKSKGASQRHVARAHQAGAFNAKNLNDATWLRNRLGLRSAFLEDGLLPGMLAARANRGTASNLRRAALEEAQQEAEAARQKGQQQDALDLVADFQVYEETLSSWRRCSTCPSPRKPRWRRSRLCVDRW